MSGQNGKNDHSFGLDDINPTSYEPTRTGEIEYLMEEMANQARRTSIEQMAAVGIGAMLNHLFQILFDGDLHSLARRAGVHPVWLTAVLRGLILPEEAERPESVKALHALGHALNWKYELWPVKPWQNFLQVAV